MRELRSCLIFVLLTIPSLLAAGSVAETLQALQPGRRIEVVMQNGEHLTGKLGDVSAEHFVVKVEGRGQASRELAYPEVRAVKTKMTRASKWGIAGGIYAVLVIIGLIVGG